MSGFGELSLARMVARLSQALGRNLRAFREAEGLTAETFAARLGVDPADLQLLEDADDEHEATLATVEAISEKVGIEPLLMLEDPSVPSK